MAAALAKFIRDRKTTHGIQKLGLDDRIRSYMGMGEDITMKPAEPSIYDVGCVP